MPMCESRSWIVLPMCCWAGTAGRPRREEKKRERWLGGGRTAGRVFSSHSPSPLSPPSLLSRSHKSAASILLHLAPGQVGVGRRTWCGGCVCVEEVTGRRRAPRCQRRALLKAGSLSHARAPRSRSVGVEEGGGVRGLVRRGSERARRQRTHRNAKGTMKRLPPLFSDSPFHHSSPSAVPADLFSLSSVQPPHALGACLLCAEFR
jgi:hypothetical protein